MERFETREGVYQGMTKEAKRYVLTFDEGEANPRKYSAFEPMMQLTELVMGENYSYEVEHVPTKDGKFYHNLARTGRDAPFKIHSLGKPQKQGTLEPKPTEATNTKVSSYTPQPGRKDTDSREAYWAEREKRELEEKRIYELRLPYINAVNLSTGVLYFMANEAMNSKSQVRKELDEHGFENTFDTILRQAEAVVQKRLPAEAAYSRENAQKKGEPIEAVV
jgi:hypothetical protein